MQSNVTGIIDDLNDFPDSWIELYNDSDEPVQLIDYKIGIKKKVDNADQLPDRLVLPGEYIIIYCDKAETGLHTSFRLESNKEGTVYLFKNGEQIQKVDHPAFPAPDIAYGLDPETGKWGYEFTATPGYENVPGTCDADHILGTPTFSEGGGVFYTPMTLAISIPEDAPEGTVIRYTTDGSKPSLTSPEWDVDSVLDVTRTTLIRATLFCEGWLSPFTLTQSYIFPDHEISLPVVSLVSDDRYFYNDTIGIYVTGLNSKSPNFRQDWRRPVNFEIYDRGHTDDFLNQLCECRFTGNGSRGFPLKSMAIYSNKRFGVKRLDYEFFPEELPGERNFKSIVMRNSGNDFYECYMRDAVIHNTVGRNMNVDYQAAEPCVLYLNGVYMGILNIRERSNEDYMFTHYDELEDVDIIENWGTLSEGSLEEFEKFRDFYNENDHSEEEYAAQADIYEIIDVHFANLFYNNCDFPGNNAILWRDQNGGRWRLILKDMDYGMGLKYGYAYGNPFDYETLSWFYEYNYPGANNWGNLPRYTLLFRQLTSIPSVFENYIDRSLVYMGDFMNSRETIKQIDRQIAKIAPEWQYHYDKNGYQNVDYGTFDDNIEYMKDWIKRRDVFFPHHFAETYSLGRLGYFDIQADDSDVDILVNDISLKTGEFHGFYPTSRKIRLEAAATEQTVAGWRVEFVNDTEDAIVSDFVFTGDKDDGKLGNNNPETESIPDKDVVPVAEMPLEIIDAGDTPLGVAGPATLVLEGASVAVSFPRGAKHVKFTPIVDTTTSIMPVAEAATTGVDNMLVNEEVTEVIYDLQGRVVTGTLQPGIYIVKKGTQTRKIAVR